jgi:putative ABC transport system substrate-binding protein
MRRREFVALLSGAIVALPRAVSAQQQNPVIGFLGSTSANQYSPFVSAFLKGLKQGGFVDKQNASIEYRWAESHYERLPTLASDLIAQHISALVASGPPAALAAKKATSTLPIVFIVGADPVALGLVASMNRPERNLTGYNFAIGELTAKMLQVIIRIVPNATNVAILINPTNALSPAQENNARIAAKSLNIQIFTLTASNESELETAFVNGKERQVDALLVAADPFFLNSKENLVMLSKRFSIPTVYTLREYAVAGGLVSYGSSIGDGYFNIGLYVGRILKGEKPTDLPVQEPAKFEMVINLKTAKALGLTISDQMQLLADEVIE